MVTRKIKISIGEFYHVYNRRNDKRPLFIDEFDKKRFVKLLFLCNSSLPVNTKELPKGLPFGGKGEVFDRGETLVDIGAYCLMPTHFHLLLREKIEGGISKFIGKLSTAYSMSFNKKYGRTGRLFEGTFKAKHLDEDRYLKYIFAYIHLNPIKLFDLSWKEKRISDTQKAKNFLMGYKYSSYPDYVGITRKEALVLNKSVFPEYFASFNEFEKYVDEWLNFVKGDPLQG